MTNHYYGIDIIRFFAAILVVGFHFGYLNNAADFGAIWPVTWFGWVGVEIFFVISGFVIANSADNASPTQFLGGRVRRLYPAVWFCATVTLLVSSHDDPLFPYLRSMALVPKGPWISPVYWTLAVEIVFYALVFGLLCVRGFRLLNYVAFTLTISSSSFLFGTSLWGISDHMNILLLRHGCFFALGVWLWLLTKRQLLAWEYAAAIVAIIACIVEICLRGSEFLPHPFGLISIAAPVFVWITSVFCIWLSSRGHILQAPKRASFTRTIGLMTYPLYLIHLELGHQIIVALISRGADKWTAVAIASAVVLFLSWIVCTFWEPKVRKTFSTATAMGAKYARNIVA
jgi:peptidoglycan/LPS O-acetylase OafA/YrhL